MKEIINQCITEIKEKSEIQGREGYDLQAPKNPALIVNYNLDNKMAENYFNYLKQLWPSVARNLPQTERKESFEEIINELRGNQLFSDFNVIGVHILVNLTSCDTQNLKEFLDKKFSGPEYKVILHEFLDYESWAGIPKTEENLLWMLKEYKGIRYQFIYSNRLFNGGMWRGENALKLLRLAANITAIMSIDSHFFNNGDTYTFSYNLLEKPTRKIVQFTIQRILERMSSYTDGQDLDQDIAKRFYGIMKREVGYRTAGRLFHENDFKYLPSNKGFQKEKKNVVKSVAALEKNYPVAASCYHAMIKSRTKEIAGIRMQEPDFTQEINDALSYYNINSFFGNNRDKDDLIQPLKESLMYEQDVSDVGSYETILAKYANQKIENIMTQQIFESLNEQIIRKAEKAVNIKNWIADLKNDDELQINMIESEENLVEYYGKLVDDYWAGNMKKIIQRLDECMTQGEVLRNGLYPTLIELFRNIPIYYKSFEEEIDERVGKNTARNMFEKISEEENINRNICCNMKNLQFSLNLSHTNEVILLINPNSRLLELEITDNYETLKLNRQDCVERIDFHVLSFKEEDS